MSFSEIIGQEAAKNLLINAAKLLKKHFGEYEIYRSGGDEFVVIAPGLEKEVLCSIFSIRSSSI